MVVLSELGCSEDVFDSVPSGCARSRGSLFNVNKSSTWTDVGTYEINEDGLGFQGNLGYSQRAQWGIDEVGIGLTGPRLENQTVAGIATAEPFYLSVMSFSAIDWTDLSDELLQWSVWAQQSASQLLRPWEHNESFLFDDAEG